MTLSFSKPFDKIFQALVFGVAFGFLLQKGDVAKYHILVGQLLLRDFTVAKVMLTAILVAMIGLYFLHNKRKVEFHIKPTKIGSNIIGGLIFGVGFAMAGYCPGTGAAALGQGDLLSIIFMLGLVSGSYLFAELSGFFKKTIETWGDKGKLTLPSLLGVKTGAFVTAFAVLLTAVLFLLSRI